MLKDLPRNSIVFGGTDPGRFVPTYMIFGESGQPPSVKRDPSFDRRDLYIITQNALGEEFYMNYIRDHYGEGRPKPKNAFERWLGRDGMYPEKPLVLPMQDQVKEVVAAAMERNAEPGEPVETDPSLIVFGEVLKWIWENNRDQHDMFVEESFPLRWTYDYAMPHGLVYQLMKEKVTEIPKEVVERDFQFWSDYKARLLGDPNYAKDLDAQRSFSKLRGSLANIYHHRKMEAEAERAYLEALELWPANPEVLFALSRIYWDKNDFESPIRLLEKAYAQDPNSEAILQLAVMSEQRKTSNSEIQGLQAKLKANPKDEESFIQLMAIYGSWGETNKSVDFIEQGLQTFSNSPDVLKTLASFTEGSGMKSSFVRAAQLLTEADPKSPMSHYILARALLASGKTNESFAAAETSIQLGGRNVRELFSVDGAFTNARTNEPFKSLLKPPIPEPQAIKESAD
jgi:cytochrome c-type biogenesis protein CcmH/NrfG